MSITLKEILTSLLVLTPHPQRRRKPSRRDVDGEADPRSSRRLGPWQRRRTRRRLRELSDRELRDIGLTRSEAEHEARTVFWR